MKSRDHVRLSLEALEDRATPTASSLFNAGLDGWTTIRDDGRGTGATGLQWRSPGGNPGGFVLATDKQDSRTWYWKAPAKFLGDHANARGAFLTFDLRQSVTHAQFNAPDVILKGGPTGGVVTLTLDTPRNPKTSWTSYAAQLTETGGWKVAGTSLAPTSEQLAAVLGNVRELRIRGEYTSATGTGGLDNVILGDSAPRLSINNVSRKEGRSGNTAFQFTATLSHIVPTAVTVNYSTADGTARAGTDYAAVSNKVLTFNAGETSKAVTLQVKGDRAREANETFFVNLSSASDNAVIAAPTGIGTILNDD